MAPGSFPPRPIFLPHLWQLTIVAMFTRVKEAAANCDRVLGEECGSPGEEDRATGRGDEVLEGDAGTGGGDDRTVSRNNGTLGG